MSGPKKPRREDEDIIFLETESRSDVARALAEAERAIEAVEEKHRKTDGARPVAVAPPAPDPPPAPPAPRRARSAPGRSRGAPDRSRGTACEGTRARDSRRGGLGPRSRGAAPQVGGFRQPEAPDREGQGRVLPVRARGGVRRHPRRPRQLRARSRPPRRRPGRRVPGGHRHDRAAARPTRSASTASSRCRPRAFRSTRTFTRPSCARRRNPSRRARCSRCSRKGTFSTTASSGPRA